MDRYKQKVEKSIWNQNNCDMKKATNLLKRKMKKL